MTRRPVPHPLRHPVPALRALVLAALVAAGCSTTPATRYLVEVSPAGAEPAPVRLRVASIELRDLRLPAHVEGSQILREGAAGELVPIRGAEWADGSAAAITAELAQRLDRRSSATVAAEPWPLPDPAALRLEVRLTRAVARADGRFQVSGQYAVTASEGQMRDFIAPFDIAVPMQADRGEARAVAEAYGRALGELADTILARLARR